MQLKKISRDKKAQEEMVGFVLIMLLVAVIFLVFLGIYLWQNKTTERNQNAEISQFLDAALEFTTTCTTDGVGYHFLDISELISKCDSRANCDSGEKSCDVLYSTIKGMIESSWTFSSESPNKGYETEITRTRETTAGKTRILNPSPYLLSTGCNSKTGADKPLFSNAGTISFSLNICLD